MPSLAVTRIGMVSALGLDASTSCAAARAGLSRIVETDELFVDDLRGEELAPVPVHRVPRVSAGLFGFARLLQLGLAALADLERAAPASRDGRTGLVLLVGDGRYLEAWCRKRQRALGEATAAAPAEAESDIVADASRGKAVHERVVKDLLATLVARSGLDVAPGLRLTLAGGASALVAALKQAGEWLQRRECDRCLVGGIDSLIDATVLAALEGLGLLRTPNRAVGMLPGEAAGFLMLERPADVEARREPAAAVVVGEAAASEAGHPLLEAASAPRDGLRAAIAEAIAQLPDRGAATALAVANLNGDSYRAESWGRNTLRTIPPLGVGALPLWVPPLHFGDVGAATGPLALAMLARGWARGYAPRPGALVCLLDDAGARGAICVRAPEELAA